MKYVATIESKEGNEFKIYFEEESNTLQAVFENQENEEVYDLSSEEEITDEVLVEKVYALYNTSSFEIIDCIEY